MVVRGTPKNNMDKYITINNDNIIYQLSRLGIFPKYIDDKQAYFEKQNLTLDIINDIIYKGEIEHWKI